MEARKVQRVGSGSLSICLPKVWTNRFNILPGTTLNILSLNDGGIAIRPFHEPDGQLPQLDAHILVSDKVTRPGFLSRLLIGCYIVGHERIEVVSSNPLSEMHLREIHETSHRVMGLSVMEEEPQRAVLQVALDLEKFNLSTLLRRQADILSLMFPMALETASGTDKIHLQEFVDLENEMNQLYWLALRYILYTQQQVLSGLDHTSMPALELLGDRTISKSIECAADQIGGFVQTLKSEHDHHRPLFDQPLYERLKELTESCLKLFEDALTALMDNDIEKADQIITCHPTVLPEVSDLHRWMYSRNIEAPADILAHQYTWAMRSMTNVALTVAEITINRSLETPNEYCLPLQPTPDQSLA